MNRKRARSNSSAVLALFKWLALGLLVLGVSTAAQAKDIPGSTRTSYGVSSSGAFQFQIPIIIPQGRNGIQPNLSLSFSSSGGNGMAGIGWGVSGLGAITRCGKTFATNGVRSGVQHNADDRFCLNGQQLVLLSGTYGHDGSEYRTEIDQFAKIIAVGNNTANINGGTVPDSWEVYLKNGSIQEYGLDANTAYTLPGTSSIHSWKLNRVNDRNGNYYKVQYRTDDGFPKQIDYTYGSGLSAQQKITYNYEARPDVRERYFLGQKITTDERLKSIVVENSSVVTREYRLAYQANDVAFSGAGATGQSRLASVTEYGMNGTAMPPITIQWQDQTAGFVTSTTAGAKAPDSLVEYYTFTRNLGGGLTEANSVKQITRGQWVDVNGDGETDMILSAILPNGSILTEAHIKVNGIWQEQPGWRLPEPLRDYSNSITNGTTGRFTSDVVNRGQFADVNGDGLVDIVYSYDMFTDNAQSTTRDTYQKTYLNTGGGWTGSTAYAPKDILFDYISNGGGNHVYVQTVRGSLLDINGDGLVDWVTAYYDYTSNGNGNEIKSTWLNNGTTWVRNTAYDMPDVFTQYRGVYSINHGQFVDVNGDGLIDWVQSYHASLETPQTQTWLNTGTGWNNSTPAIYNLPDIIFSNLDGWNNVAPLTRGRFVDVNGDGLRDWVRSYETVGGATGAHTWLNKGKGWVSSASYAPPFHYANNRYSDFERGWPLNVRGQHLDLNRDGLVDYVESYKSSATGFPVSKKAWLNTGSTWQLQAANSVYTPTDLFFDYSGRENAKSHYGQYLDINSDGAADWVATREGTTLSAKLAITPRVNLLKSITTTMGVEIKPAFLPLTANDSLYKQYPKEGSSTIAEEADSYYVRGASYVTASVTAPTPDPSVNSVSTYQYQGAQVSRKRGFLGFKRFTTMSSLTGISATSQYNQTFPYIGLTESSATTLNDHELASSSSVFANVPVTRLEGIKTYFRYASSSTSEQSELASNSNGVSYRKTEVDQLAYDAYGNLETQRTRVFNGSGNPTHTTIVDNDYVAPNLTHWLVGLVSKTTQTNTTTGLAPISNVTKFEYHQNDKGQLHQVLREPDQADDSVKLTTTYSYDVYGNVESETTQAAVDPQAPIDTIFYDAAHRLPITLRNALLQESTIAYHPQCDQPSKVTDPNGLDVDYTYDNFCRQVTATSADDITTTNVYSAVNEACPENDCQRAIRFKLTSEDTDASQTAVAPAVTQYFSAFNQTLLTTTGGMNDEPIRQQNVYDKLGRVVSSSQPYFAGDDKHLTEVEYDALGRQTKTRLPYNDENGVRAEQNYTYSVSQNLLERHVEDVKGRFTTARVNAIGQVVEVEDAHNKILAYGYDSQGNLTQTTDAQGNSITLGYDVLGRRITLDDPDLGLSSYVYNGFSELVSQTDAKLQTISMEYDELGRLVQRHVPGDVSLGGGYSKWEYDEAPRGAVGEKWFGAVSKVEGLKNQINAAPNYLRTFTYDSLGRASSETTTIDGIGFNESYVYDSTGRLSERYYPNSSLDQSNAATAFGVTYQYQNGYLSSVMSAGGTQCIEHWRAQNYDALGRVDLETVGSLVATQRDFKPGQNVLERIRSVTTVATPTVVQNLTYTYDSVNNLKTRNDLENNIAESFGYDNLDRLTSHSRDDGIVAPVVTTVAYDDIGNITFKSDVGHYSYNLSEPNSVRPHAVKGITGAIGDANLNVSTADLSKFNVNWEYNGADVVRSLPTARQALLQVAGQPDAIEYDANGNATKSGNRSIAWTAFDKPQRMAAALDTDGTSKVSVYQYGPEQQRIIKREATVNALSSPIDVPSTTIYIGKYYERLRDENGNVTHRYMIQTGGATIQIDRDEGSSIDRPKYLLADNLGSTHVILNGLAEIEQTLAFDPWGARLNVGDNSNVNSVTNRGYTGHEMDDEVGLINMNARVYDPYLGRFLSADPVLPDAGDMQSFNRYSYVTNNPLGFVDPTGNAGCGIAYGNVCGSDGNPIGEPSPPASSGGFGICAGGSAGGVFVGGCSGGASPFSNLGGGFNPYGIASTVLNLASQGLFAQDDVGYARFFTDLRGMENAIRNAAERSNESGSETSTTVASATPISGGSTVDENIASAAAGDPDNILDRIGVFGTRTTARRAQSIRNSATGCRNSSTGCQDDFFSAEQARAFQSMSIDAATAGGGRIAISGGALAVGGVRAASALTAAKDLPVLEFSRSRLPNISANIADAIADGAPSVLNRITLRSLIRGNRRDALRGQAAAGPGKSLDEFPFASCAQGGAGACVRAVPVAEQNAQGGILSQFFRRNDIGDGDAFRVRVVD